MHPLRPSDFAEAKMYFRSKYPDPLTGIAKRLEGLPESVQQTIALKAYEDSKNWGDLKTPEGLRWATSGEGMAVFFWLSVRREDKSITVEEIIGLFEEQQEETLKGLMDQLDEITGLAEEAVELGKSQALSPAQRKAREKALKKALRKKTGK